MFEQLLPGRHVMNYARIKMLYHPHNTFYVQLLMARVRQ